MSLRSPFTQLTSILSLRARVTWAGVAAAFGLMVSATGCGGCDGASLQKCPTSIGPGMCICDGLGCRPADQTTATGNGGTTGTGGTATGGSGTGGAAPCDPVKSTCPCDNGTCPTGKACINNLCVVGCNFTYECGAGKVCADGACVPGCDTTHGCDVGYTCTNGACVLDPNKPQCSSAQPCPAGEICSNGICTTGCTENSDCASGEICDGSTHACIPDPSPKPVCSTSMPCPNGEICEDDGFCHYTCATTADCKLIDNRFTCDSGICKTDQEINPQCTLSMPCPAGKTCISNTCF